MTDSAQRPCLCPDFILPHCGLSTQGFFARLKVRVDGGWGNEPFPEGCDNGIATAIWFTHATGVLGVVVPFDVDILASSPWLDQ